MITADKEAAKEKEERVTIALDYSRERIARLTLAIPISLSDAQLFRELQ